MLASSTVPETDYAAWSASTNYTKDMRVIRPNHRIYQSVAGGTDSTPPENATTGTSPKWVDIGPTNRWAMFDDVVGTVTTVASPLTVVLRPGPVSGISLQELSGRQARVTLKTAPGGTVVYDRTEMLDATPIQSFYDWFFADFVQRTDVTLNDLPAQYMNGELTISITGSGASAVGCGVCKVGRVEFIGSTQMGVTVGIADYSTKTRDTFGRLSVVQRAYSKRMTLKAMVDRADFNRVTRLLASLRATPAVWIANDAQDLEALRIYGFFKDFNIEVAYPTYFVCSIEIEGLV
jgi:hypothetical protein